MFMKNEVQQPKKSTNFPTSDIYDVFIAYWSTEIKEIMQGNRSLSENISKFEVATLTVVLSIKRWLVNRGDQFSSIDCKLI